MTLSHSSGVILRKSWRMLMPALLINTLTPPMMRSASSNAASTCLRLETSAASTPAKPGRCRRILSFALASRSSTHTAEPSSRKRAAVAAPIPLAPPVIKTRLPFKPRIGLQDSTVIGNQFAASGSQFSDRFSAKEVDQFDNQNDYDHEFQHEGTALVKLVHHEAIEFLGSLHLLGDQVFVIRNANFGGREFVQTSGKHVAEKLDRVVGVLGEFVHVEQDGVQLGRGARQAPTRQHSGALVERCVNAFQFAGEEFIVMAEFEQLRVGIFQQLNGGLGAGFAVIQKSRIPTDYCQIIGVIRDARLQDFVLLPFRELRGFSTNDLRDTRAMRRNQLIG